MIIKVDKNFINFDNDTLVNKKEYNVTPLKFEFSKEYEGLTCKAIFSNISDEETIYYQEPIINNECKIPYEVLDSDIIVIGVYAYDIEEGELILRYSPSPKKLVLLEGSYYDGASSPEEITPTQFEEYTSYLNSQIEKLDKMKITTESITDGVKISITNSDGVTTNTNIYNGEKGDKGETGATGATGAPGRDGYVQYTAGNNITITDNVISATDTTYTFDNTPTEDSLNPVTSGGIYTYINNILGDINTILETLVTVEESE